MRALNRMIASQFWCVYSIDRCELFQIGLVIKLWRCNLIGLNIIGISLPLFLSFAEKITCKSNFKFKLEGEKCFIYTLYIFIFIILIFFAFPFFVFVFFSVGKLKELEFFLFKGKLKEIHNNNDVFFFFGKMIKKITKKEKKVTYKIKRFKCSPHFQIVFVFVRNWQAASFFVKY